MSTLRCTNTEFIPVLEEQGDSISYWTHMYKSVYPIMIICGFPPIPPRHMLAFMPLPLWSIVITYVYISLSMNMSPTTTAFEYNPILKTMVPTIHASLTAIMATATMEEAIPVLYDLLNPSSGMEGGGTRKSVTYADLFELFKGGGAAQSKQKTRKRTQRGGSQLNLVPAGNGARPASAAAASAPRSSNVLLSSALAPSQFGLTQEQVSLGLMRDPDGVLAQITQYWGVQSVVCDLQRAVNQGQATVVIERLSLILASLQRDHAVLKEELDKAIQDEAEANVKGSNASATGAAKNNGRARMTSVVRGPSDALVVRPSALGPGANVNETDEARKIAAARKIAQETPLRRNANLEKRLSVFGQRLRNLAQTTTMDTPFALNARKTMAARPTAARVRNDAINASLLCCCKGTAGVGAIAGVKNLPALKLYAERALDALTIAVPVAEAPVVPLSWYQWTKGGIGWVYGGIGAVTSDAANAGASVVRDATLGTVSTTLTMCCGTGEGLRNIALGLGYGACCIATTGCAVGTCNYGIKKYTEYSTLQEELTEQKRLDDAFMRRMYRYSLQSAAKYYFDQMESTVQTMRSLFMEPSFADRIQRDPRLREAAFTDFFSRRTAIYQQFMEVAYGKDYETLITGIDRSLMDEEAKILQNLEGLMGGNGLFKLLSKDDKDYIKKNFDRLFQGNAALARKHEVFKAELLVEQQQLEATIKGGLVKGLNFAKIAAGTAFSAAAATASIAVVAGRAYMGDPTAMAGLAGYTSAAGGIYHASNAGQMAANHPGGLGPVSLQSFAQPAAALSAPLPALASASASAPTGASYVDGGGGGAFVAPRSLGSQLAAQARSSRLPLENLGVPQALGNGRAPPLALGNGRAQPLALGNGLRYRGPAELTGPQSSTLLERLARQAQAQARAAPGALALENGKGN